ncbi:MAG TPA: hypothetical protein PLB52_00600 [Candidatus Moranbacteria bacterium]|nr:hypothetical protein [Candidatus Moranbacteria bacterium]
MAMVDSEYLVLEGADLNIAKIRSACGQKDTSVIIVLGKSEFKAVLTFTEKIIWCHFEQAKRIELNDKNLERVYCIKISISESEVFLFVQKAKKEKRKFNDQSQQKFNSKKRVRIHERTGW